MLRNTLKKTARKENILVHFPIDDTLSVIKRNNILGDIIKGTECRVKEGSKIYDAKIIEIGDDEALLEAENAFYDSREGKKSSEDDKTRSDDTVRTKNSKKKSATQPTDPAPTPKRRRKTTCNTKKEEKGKGSIICVSDHTDSLQEDLSVRTDCNFNDQQPAVTDGLPTDYTDHNDAAVIDIATDDMSYVQSEVFAISPAGTHSVIAISPTENSDQDSLAFELSIDELDTRVSKIEQNLTSVLAKLSKIEHILQRESTSHLSDLQPVSKISTPAQYRPSTHINSLDQPLHCTDQSQHEQSPPQQQMFHANNVDLRDIEIPPLPPTVYVTPPSRIVKQNNRLQPLQLSNHQYSSSLNTAPRTPSSAPPTSAMQQCLPGVDSCSRTPSSTPPTTMQQCGFPTLKSAPPTLSSGFNQPQCFAIEGRKRKEKNTSLSSLEIKKENLMPYDTIIKKYPSLRQENVIGKLAVKLARESFFGADVLAKCTVMGCRDFPALPVNELNELKQLIFSMFPTYWNTPIEFESKVWCSCVTSIGQLCKRLRGN